jgi:sterol desaturase/sphingolipid hydroxylase (fatty acid hydroxylase superfamily)
MHRASHVVPWLWGLHAIHHSARRVYWLSGQLRQIVHELLEGLPGLVVVGLLGAPATVVACFMAAITLHVFFQHGNIEYRLGPFTRVFAVAELHRWHHQPRYEDVQGNYGAILSIWDFAVGTALPQKGDAPLDVGMGRPARLAA